MVTSFQQANCNTNVSSEGAISYEGMTHLVCRDENEIKKVNEVVKEATSVLKELAATEEGYTLYNSKPPGVFLYFKKFNNSDVGKIRFQIQDSSKIEKLINKIWDVNGSKIIDSSFIEGKIVRIYDMDTVLIHHCYKGTFGVEGRYFYVIANKHQIDENTYIITCVSVNVNDSGDLTESSDKNSNASTSNTYSDATCKKIDNSFINPFIKSANTFSLSVDPSICNLNTSLKKMYINLSGYVISKNKTNIDVNYVSSVQLGLSSIIPNFFLKKIKANKMMLLQSLKNCL